MKKKEKRKLHPNSLANLKPVHLRDKDLAKKIRQKGQAVQQKNKRAKKTLTQELLTLLEANYTVKGETKNGKQLVTSALVKKAVAGDIQAQKLIFERAEGLLEQAVKQEITLNIVKSK